MKKWFAILILGIMFFTSGCSEKSYIVFNKQPITQENILDADYIFEKGQRVYYVITLPEPVFSKQLFIQIYKRDNKEMRYGYKLIYGKTVKLLDETQSHYTDYFVFSENGLYEFKVYSKDNPTKELTSNFMQVQ